MLIGILAIVSCEDSIKDLNVNEREIVNSQVEDNDLDCKGGCVSNN